MKIRKEIEQLAENSSEVQEATYTSQHKITYQHGYIDGYFQCQEDMADEISNLTKELEEVRKNYINHTIGCEIWRGSKLLLLDKVKKENECLLNKIHEIDSIVDKEVFDVESNEFKIWKIINSLNKQD